MVRKVFGWVWSFLEVLIIVYVIFVTSCILFRNKYGFTQFGSYTMVSVNELRSGYLSNVEKGSLFLVKSTNDLNQGDMIYYYAPTSEQYVIRSGVIKTKVTNDGASLYTLADEANTTVASTRVLGKYTNSYPKLGAVKDFLESQIGFLFCVLLPIMIVFIYQIYEFIVAIKYDDDDEDDDFEEVIKEAKKNHYKKENKETKVIKEEKETKENKENKEKETKKPEVKEEKKTVVKKDDEDIEIL